MICNYMANGGAKKSNKLSAAFRKEIPEDIGQQLMLETLVLQFFQGAERVQYFSMHQHLRVMQELLM